MPMMKVGPPPRLAIIELDNTSSSLMSQNRQNQNASSAVYLGLKMDGNSAHSSMSIAASGVPNHINMKPYIPHHQNPLLHSSSITTYPPPLPETGIISPSPSSSSMLHHQPYEPNYPHPQQQQLQNYGYSNNDKQHINTLFVSGLPDDVKAREIHNLFRRRHGFDSCQLKYTGRGNQVVAFATFFNHHSAMAAMNELNGVTFDPQTGAVLHIELARSNSRTKSLQGAGGYFIIDKRVKVSTDVQDASSDDGDDGSDEPSGTDNPDSSSKGGLATTESAEATTGSDDAGAEAKEQPEDTVAEELQPCSTLFIANLGPNCTEEELKQALSQYPGFNIVKMRAKRGMPVAFADFEDVEQANEAMRGLQGSMLPSSDRGGLHLEYARSKMRKS